MAVTRLCIRVCMACIGDSFIIAHKSKEGMGGPDYVKSCRSNHKAQVFARLCPGESASATIADDTNAADFDSEDNDGTIEGDDEIGSDDDDVILDDDDDDDDDVIFFSKQRVMIVGFFNRVYGRVQC